MNRLKVLHVASEIYPLVKTGGLADVAAALLPAQRVLGIDARVLLPGHPSIMEGLLGLEKLASLPSFPGADRVELYQGRLPESDLPAFVVNAPDFFDRPGNPYLGPDGQDWPDNHRRFALLSRCGCDVALKLWPADVLHAHDWHAGLSAAYVAAAGGGPGTVFTVHNLAYQGLFSYRAFPDTGLPAGFFALEGAEFYGQLSFMKAGLHFSHRITTVSPSYALEIQSQAYGAGLDGLLRSRAGDVTGILNGVDYGIWNPSSDPAMARPFDCDRLAGKRDCKEALARGLGLQLDPAAPLFGVVSRLTDQKGLDLLLHVMPWLLDKGGKLALLGSGDAVLEAGFRRLAEARPESCGVVIGYDEAMAHRIIGGCDAVVVPSRFEPCGLTQLFALKYGSLPVVRRTGGLKDTVVDSSEETVQEGTATGFVFDAPSSEALRAALSRCLACYSEPAAWRRVMMNAMGQDFSWEKAAAAYEKIYGELAQSR